jgi:hypothetical protein
MVDGRVFIEVDGAIVAKFFCRCKHGLLLPPPLADPTNRRCRVGSKREGTTIVLALPRRVACIDRSGVCKLTIEFQTLMSALYANRLLG